MENLNPDKKKLDQIIDEADGQKMKIVIVEEPMSDGHHRLAAFLASPHFMVIRMENLTEEDQNKIRSASKEKELDNSPFKNPPIPIKSMEQFRDEIVLDERKLNPRPFDKNMKPPAHNKRAYVPKIIKTHRGRR